MGIIDNRDAQFMLLAGFIISIGLVITTVILNSIIFEGNMAIGAGVEPTKNEIINLMQITKDEVRSAYRNVTDPGANYSLRFANFSKQINSFSSNLTKIYALHGTGVNFTQDIRNWNNNLSANLTKDGTASGEKNWTVVESVRNITMFELRNVSGSNFEVNISNQTTGAFLWSMRLNGTNNIAVRNASSNICDCAVDFEYIDLLNGSYSLQNNVGNNITKISFINGSNASGKFNISGNTSYGRNFTRSHDYILNVTVKLSTSRLQANITFPVSVPW